MARSATNRPDAWDGGALSSLSRVRLDALLQELIVRTDEVLDAQERLRGLLDAVVELGADLDLDRTLERIVQAACTLSDARYGALGVVGWDGRHLSRFITTGIDEEQIAAIGPYPEGHGILGLLVEHPGPLRLKDLSQHASSYGFPAGHPEMKSFLGVPIRSRGRTYGNLYLTEKQGGSDFSEDDERTVLALATAAGVMIDNVRLYADTERRQHWHEATAQIIQTLMDDVDPEGVLRLIVRKAREVSRSLVGAILVTENDDVIVRALDGPSSFGPQLSRRFPGAGPILAGVLDGRDRVVIEDLARLAEQRGLLTALPELEDLGRTIIAPLPPGSDHDGGVLVVAAARGVVLGVTPGTDLLTMFANQTTLALDRAQDRSSQSLLSVLAERDQLAQTLHESVIQRLFEIGLRLQSLQRLLPPEAAAQVARAVDDLDSTIRDLRDAVFERPHQPDRDSFRAHLTALVDEYAGPLGFRPGYSVSSSVDTAVTADAAAHLLAVLREALSNVVRHAHASAVQIDLEVTGRVVVLRVADDGVGVGATERRSGLRNLQARAAALGGAVELSRNGSHGTIVELRATVGPDPTAST